MRKKSSLKKMLLLFTFVCLLTISVLYINSMAAQRSIERNVTAPNTLMQMAAEQNELADRLPSVAIYYDNGLHGMAIRTNALSGT